MLKKTFLLALFACFLTAASYAQNNIYIVNQTCSFMDIDMKIGTIFPCNGTQPYTNTVAPGGFVGPIVVSSFEFVLNAEVTATGTTNQTSVSNPSPSCGGNPNGLLGPLLCDPVPHPVSYVEFGGGTTQVVFIQ